MAYNNYSKYYITEYDERIILLSQVRLSSLIVYISAIRRIYIYIYTQIIHSNNNN